MADPAVILHVLALGRQPVDGRPLYAYGVTAAGLDALERRLCESLCSDSNRVEILAPLAAGRFAANYVEGAPSWEHCGNEIGKLYRKNVGRFSDLMERSLRHYKIQVLKYDAGDSGRLSTIVANSGLPAPMLAEGRPLRGLLNRLMSRVTQGEDLLAVATDLVKINPYLPDRYRKSEFFPKLCCDLIEAVWALKQKSQWDGGSLNAIWEIEGWQRELPFTVPEESAKAIVTSLLGVAEDARKSGPLSIDRILRKSGGQWQLSASAALPEGGHRFEEAAPKIVRLRYSVDGHPVDEACRLQRHKDGVYVLALPPFNLSPTLAQPTAGISLVAEAGLQIRTTGGEPLDAGLPWVFAPDKTERHVLVGSGTLRSPHATLLVVVPPDASVSGDGCERDSDVLVIPWDGEPTRSVWRVTGRASVRIGSDESTIQANYDGPQTVLKLSGRFVELRVSGCPLVFKGPPTPLRVGGLAGTIEWRRSDTDWQSDTSSARGRVRYRLLERSNERQIVAAERSALVLPSEFELHCTLNKVTIRLGEGFRVLGWASPRPHEWEKAFDGSRDLAFTLEGPGGAVAAAIERALPTSFTNVVTREQMGERRDYEVDVQMLPAIVASSTQHRSIDVRRMSAASKSARPFLLSDGQLSISGPIRSFLRELAVDSDRIGVGLRMEFHNGPSLVVKSRQLVPNSQSVSVEPPRDDDVLELHELIPDENVEQTEILLQKMRKGEWSLPNLIPGRVYIVKDARNEMVPRIVVKPGPTSKIDPRTLAYSMSLSDREYREASLIGNFQAWLDTPNDGLHTHQIDIYLRWLGRFQQVLDSLDPFLVLRKSPELALKVYALSRLKCEEPAQQGLEWAFSKTPLFWHCVSGVAMKSAFSWVRQWFGDKCAYDIAASVSELARASIRVSDLSLGATSIDLFSEHLRWRSEQSRQALNPAERRIFEQALRQKSDVWLSRVSTQLDAAREVGAYLTPLNQVEAFRDALKAMTESSRIEVLNLQTRNRLQVNSREFEGGYFLAPFVLATCAVKDELLTQPLRDDLMYVRQFISEDAFDDAFFYTQAFMERNQ